MKCPASFGGAVPDGLLSHSLGDGQCHSSFLYSCSSRTVEQGSCPALHGLLKELTLDMCVVPKGRKEAHQSFPGFHVAD